MTVPFAFQAGITHFAPGAYTISVSANGFISIRGVSNSGLTKIVMQQGGIEQSPVSQLVFRRFGNRYFLREVWTKGDSVHLWCLKSKAEGQAERVQRAADRASIAAPTNVEIALLETHR